MMKKLFFFIINLIERSDNTNPLHLLSSQIDNYPPLTTASECSEILNLLNEYGIKKCYYGHLHGDAAKYAIDGCRNDIDFKLISCDRLNFTPYLILK